MENTEHTTSASSPNTGSNNSSETTSHVNTNGGIANSTTDNPANSNSSETSSNGNDSRTHTTHHATNISNSTGPAEHSDSTMSNPVNDKVDTSEKANDSTETNSAFDLSYFDGIYKTKEKDDPLDLSYFESPYDKNKIEDYLKRNVETGNQLAYNEQDFTDSMNRIDAIQPPSPTLLNRLYDRIMNSGEANERETFNNDINAAKTVLQDVYNDINISGTVDNRKIEALNRLVNTTETLINGTNALDPYKESFEKLKREIEFAKEKAEDIKSHGVTKNSGISAASERQQIEDQIHHVKDNLMSAYASGDPTTIDNAKRAYERVADRLRQDYEGSAAMELVWDDEVKPDAVFSKMEYLYGSAPTETETPITPTRTETPTTPATRTTTEASEATPTSTTETSDTTVTETPDTTVTETPTETTETTETEAEIPETIDEEPSEETHTVMDVMEHLDDGRRWWEFGSEDYERTRKQIARVSPSAEEEFMEFADLINDIVNGSAGDKVKAVLKLISKAAWDTFNIIPKVCVDMTKDIIYRLIKGDYDTSGLTDAEQKQVERFSHNKKNVAMMNSMLDTIGKPKDTSIRGKGKGQATDESDYNEGMTEATNDVVSDVTKKYIINHPWVFKAIKGW